MSKFRRLIDQRVLAKAFCFVFVLLAGATGIYLFLREPRLQGRPVTDWLDDLTASDLSDAVPESREHRKLLERHQAAAEALRRNASETVLRYLLTLLSSPSGPSQMRLMIQHLLERQSYVQAKLPNLPDRAWQAVQAFRVLGPKAKSVIPGLAELIHREPEHYYSFDALEAIGPEAIPTLTNMIHSADTNAVCSAIQVLGEFGFASKDVSPALMELANHAPIPVATRAIQTLSEIDPDAAKYRSFFFEKLNDTNLTAAAAFALGRMGSEGTLLLLRALTNRNRVTSTAVAAALAPELRNLRRQNSPDYTFRAMICIYNLKMLVAAHQIYSNGENGTIAATVSPWIDDPSQAIRLKVIDILTGCSTSGIPTLARATRSPDTEVQRKAYEALKILRIPPNQ